MNLDLTTSKEDQSVFYARDYAVLPGDYRENTLHLAKLLVEAKRQEAEKLVFDRGVYHFYPDYASEKLLYISNHDEDTIKNIIFDLSGFENFTMEGHGADFIFHTDCIPFYMDDSKAVTLCGFSMDYARPSYSEADILAVEPQKTTLYINKAKYPYEVRHSRLVFTGETFEHELTEWLEFDPKRRAPVYNILDMNFNGGAWETSALCKETAENIVEVTLCGEKRFLPNSKAGNKLVLRHHPRSHPGFYVTNSRDVTVEQVNCYHATGIGFMAEHTKNITLKGFHVCINPDNPRIFTAAADATHFVYCSGKIAIENCLFENQMDDAVNIHGIYARVHKVLSPASFLAELVHPMQKGVSMGKPGELLSLVDNCTLRSLDTGTIKTIEPLNRDFIYIEMKQPLTGLRSGCVVENLSWIPDVHITGCTFRNNRARGLLLTTAGKVLVENNLFYNAGAAILLEGDANNWFESGSTKDVLIENNTFDNCCYVKDWGRAPIQATPRTCKFSKNWAYHQRIAIVGNIFRCFDTRLLYMENVGALIFQNNEIQKTNAFPPLPGETFALNHVLDFQEQ